MWNLEFQVHKKYVFTVVDLFFQRHLSSDGCQNMEPYKETMKNIEALQLGSASLGTLVLPTSSQEGCHST